MRFRLFKQSDAKACVEIINKNRKDMGDLYTEHLLVKASFYNKYWVAEEKEKIVGMIGLTDLNNGIGMIATFCVDPNFQSKGIGTALLRKIKTVARKEKYRKLLLLTHAENKRVMSLAIKEDFIPEGSLKNHFRDGKDVIYFSYFVK